jgi:hypothetical protein
VPPVSYLYNDEGRKVPATRRTIYALTHPLLCNEQSFAVDSPIPLEVVQLHNNRTENVPTVDPVNGLVCATDYLLAYQQSSNIL